MDTVKAFFSVALTVVFYTFYYFGLQDRLRSGLKQELHDVVMPFTASAFTHLLRSAEEFNASGLPHILKLWE